MGHRIGSLFNPSKRFRRLVAVDEASLIEMSGHGRRLWAVIDVDPREVLAVYTPSMLNALSFLKKVLKACEDKPLIVVDGGS